MDHLEKFSSVARESINNHFRGYDPFQIVIEVVGSLIVMLVVHYILSNFSELKNKVITVVFGGLKSIPAVQEQLNKEKAKLKSLINKKMAVTVQETGDVDPTSRQLLLHSQGRMSIPAKGIPHPDIIRIMTAIRDAEVNRWKSGKVSGCVYGGEESHTELMNQAYGLFSLSNPLHPDVFPSNRKFEIEIIQMTAAMMNGDDQVCGVVTSGGTESILMAVKAYRERANVKNPEMIIPITAHAAFDKAGEYFGIKVIHVGLDSDLKPDISQVKKAINKNTILIVGSAPNFPHGIIDPIKELAALAQKHNIGFHTDACLGGFVMAWVKKMGLDKHVEAFDFSVPGVTSISADTHKYGYATKGTSVLLFKNDELRKHMYFVAPNWPGGVYASPAISGSRPGGLIAACWASLVAVGQDGFMQKSKAIWEAAMAMKKGIQEIPELILMGDSYSTVIAFTAKSMDIFKISDSMSAKGWHLNNLQRPNCVHICVTSKQVTLVNQFLQDLRDSVKAVEENPKGFPDGLAPIYGLAASFPDRTTVHEIGVALLDAILDCSSGNQQQQNNNNNNNNNHK